MGVAGAVEPFMVFHGDLGRGQGNIVGGGENLPAIDDMLLDFFKLGIVEGAGFVEDGQGYGHLAHIVQKPAQADGAGGFLVKAHGPAKSQEQHTHAYRMVEGVFILFAHPHEQEERVPVVADGVVQLIHRCFCLAGLDLFSSPHVGKDVFCSLAGPLPYFLGPDDFMLDWDMSQFALNPCCLRGDNMLEGHRGPRVFFFNSESGGWGLILAVLDVDVADAPVFEAFNLALVLDSFAVEDKRVVQPAAIKTLDMHAGLELFDGNLLDHDDRLGLTVGVMVSGRIKDSTPK